MKTIPILYEDDEILVVNKPSGLAVQGGAGIVSFLTGILERQTAQKIYPVHRLDKDTAGIVLAAKSSAAAAKYTALMSSGSVVKEYAAVCFGAPPRKTGTISAPVFTKGVSRSAETSYTVKIGTDSFSLLSLTLGTGRMHQIRIHLAGLKCPIVGDDKYGDFPRNRAARSAYGVRRLQLAACRLTFPAAGIFRTVCVPFPEHMSSFCGAIFPDGGVPAGDPSSGSSCRGHAEKEA